MSCGLVRLISPSNCYVDSTRTFGKSKDSTTDEAMIAVIMPSDKLIGNLPPNKSLSHTIFNPTKISTTASPYFNMWNLSIAPASIKYRARKPRIAKVFDVKTINGSFVSAKMAGTESTAKMTSVASKKSSATNKGVA